MAGFKITIKRSVRIQAPLFTRAQRVAVGNIALNVVRDRIKTATDANDGPAKPLNAIRPRHGGASYVVQKQMRTGRPATRDWTLTGAMLKSLRVTVATTKRIVISPTDDQKGKMAGNQQRCEMFAISKKDEAKINAVVGKAYQDMAQRMIVASQMWRAAGAALIVGNVMDTSG
jgi:hypothetical protein